MRSTVWWLTPHSSAMRRYVHFARAEGDEQRIRKYRRT
jgi:hypothetical protein